MSILNEHMTELFVIYTRALAEADRVAEIDTTAMRASWQENPSEAAMLDEYSPAQVAALRTFFRQAWATAKVSERVVQLMAAPPGTAPAPNTEPQG